MQPSRSLGARSFDISPPPRRVPPAVRTRVLFGGALSQFGWAFFGFGMIFAFKADDGIENNQGELL